MLHPLVKEVIQSCKEDNSYVIKLKWDTIDEVKELLHKNGEYLYAIGTYIEKYSFEGKELSFYKNGKIVVKEVIDIDAFIQRLLENK